MGASDWLLEQSMRRRANTILEGKHFRQI